MKSVIIVLLLVSVLTVCVGTAGATCNSGYVLQSSKVVSVLPSGSDDTINVQCAFDLASTIPDVVLQFSKGTYKTGRVVVNGFVGTIRGMGMDETVIRNPNYPIYVAPDDFHLVPPESSAFAPAYLFVFLGGDYHVADLTVSIVGAEPATDWSIFGIRDWLGQGIKSLAGPFVILGSATGGGYREGNAWFERVKIKGELSADPLTGYNVINGIFYEGFAGPNLLPLKGTFKVTNSTFDTIASASPVVNLVDSHVTISRNIYINVAWGGELVDLRNTAYQFIENHFVGYMGVQSYDDCLSTEANCGTSASDFVIKNNVFRGAEGVWMDATFLNGTKTLVLGNNFAHVTDIAVSLGIRSSQCTVVGVGSGAVVDLGSDNSITGMKKVGTPQGQRIKTFLQIAKGR
jgi:hypothetical protein